MEDGLHKDLCDIKRLLAMIAGCCRNDSSAMSSGLGTELDFRDSFSGYNIRHSSVSGAGFPFLFVANEDPLRVILNFQWQQGPTFFIWPSTRDIPADGILMNSSFIYLSLNWWQHRALTQSLWRGLPDFAGATLNVTEVFYGEPNSRPPGNT